MTGKNYFSNIRTKNIILSVKSRFCVPIVLADKNNRENISEYNLSKSQKTFLAEMGFSSGQDEVIYLPDEKGKIAFVFIGKNE